MTSGGEQINYDQPLKVMFLSDYPIARETGERTSASAHQILDAARELGDKGHDVVMIAPGYVDRPERDGKLPFSVRTLLFTPENFIHQRNTLGPRFSFDYPVLDQNPNLTSDYLVWKMANQSVDMLLNGYMAMLRLTTLIFGEPDVVVTAHAVSPWNFAASNYPVLFMSSESDQMPHDVPDYLRNIIVEGGRRAFGGIAMSKLVRNNLLDGRQGFEVRRDSIEYISRGLNRQLFTGKAETTKYELLQRFPQLKGVSSEHRWIVLYDESGNEHVVHNLMRVASYVERKCPDAVHILVTEGDGQRLCEQIDRLQLSRMRLITNVGIKEKAWFVNAADRTVMYLGQEVPPSTVVSDLERDLMLLSLTAVVVPGDNGPRLCFPGRVEAFSEEVVDTTLAEFDRNEGDLSGEVRFKVRSAIKGLRGTRERVDTMTFPALDRPVQTRARRSIRYRARVMASQRVAKALMDEVPEKLKQLTLDEAGSGAGPAIMDIPVQSGMARELQNVLFKASAMGERSPAKLKYLNPAHSKDRQSRLDAIVFDPEVREAWEKLVKDVDEGKSYGRIGAAFRSWQHELFRALYRTKFIKSANLDAIADPRRNPDGILSEVSRLIGHRTEEVFKYLRKIREIPAVELIRVSKAASDDPGEPDGGGSGNKSPTGADGNGNANNVVRFDRRSATSSHIARSNAVLGERMSHIATSRARYLDTVNQRLNSTQPPSVPAMGRLVPIKKV
jgi:hypothetical protein